MKRKWMGCVAILLAAVLFATGCSVPWDHGGDEYEEVTPPKTSTIAGAEQAKPTEPEADRVYARYAAVRIDAVAGIRMYVDVRKAEPVVVSAQMLNEKGKAALADWDPEDMPFEEAVAILAERLMEKGIVNAFHTGVTVSLEQNGPSITAADRLCDTAKDIFSEVYGQHGLEAIFGEENVSVGE